MSASRVASRPCHQEITNRCPRGGSPGPARLAIIRRQGRTMTATANERAQLKVLPGGRGGVPDPSSDQGGRRPDLRPLALLIATVVLILLAAAAPIRRARPKPDGVFPL